MRQVECATWDADLFADGLSRGAFGDPLVYEGLDVVELQGGQGKVPRMRSRWPARWV